MAAQLDLFHVPATGTRQLKRKPVDIERNEVNHEVAKRRYYYHKQLLKYNKPVAKIGLVLFKIDGALRTIDCDYKSFESIPIGPRYYVGKLIGIGYNVQYKIF